MSVENQDRVLPASTAETIYSDFGASCAVMMRNVTPSDDVDLDPIARAIRCDKAGAVTFKNMRGQTVVFTALAGEVLPGHVKRLMATGTDNVGATDYIAFYG